MQLDKGADGNKPRSKCRRWRLQVVTDDGRRSRPFEGTYTAAQAALAAFVEELEGVVPNAETFAAYAESWRRYRELSGDYDPNTVATYRRCVNAFARSPIGGMRMDAITPESCRDALLWVKSHPQREGIDELSGTTMAKLHQGLHLILATAADDGRIASNPMAKVKPPKLDTPEKEALSWGEMQLLLNRLDAQPPSAYVLAVYAICCEGLRRSEACALLDADVTRTRTVVRQAVKEASGKVGSPKSKAGARALPTVPRFYEKVDEWRAVRASRGLADAPTLCNNAQGGVLRPQNLYRWWRAFSEENGCAGVGLHQLRHSNLTHVARSMSVFDLQRYAGWSSIEPARVYVHDDFDALSAGVMLAWAQDGIVCTDSAPSNEKGHGAGL